MRRRRRTRQLAPLAKVTAVELRARFAAARWRRALVKRTPSKAQIDRLAGNIEEVAFLAAALVLALCAATVIGIVWALVVLIGALLGGLEAGGR